MYIAVGTYTYIHTYNVHTYIHTYYVHTYIHTMYIHTYIQTYVIYIYNVVCRLKNSDGLLCLKLGAMFAQVVADVACAPAPLVTVLQVKKPPMSMLLSTL